METSFGNWIRRRRKGLDLTQEELAKRVGCSASLIFKIESDERRPSRQIAELLADQLEIPPEQRELFLKVARQDLSALHLDAQDLPPVSPAPPVPPAPPVSPAPPPNGQLPAESTEPRPLTLPVFPTTFVGREHEIDIVVQQILDPACRLLTLTGPGGVGKTRLAVEVARRIESLFADGVYFLAMAGVGLPESILPVVAGALGLIFSGPADPKQQVIRALEKKNALLIFDNMEHLIAGSTVLGEILEQAPGVRLLLTSREPVHLQWEWIFEVQGLPVPEAAQPGKFESSSAAALFLQRTRQTAQHSAINAEEVAAILQICKLVDGLPLAIELAASWARVMSPGEIAEELARGLDLLETTLQDVPTRHRSIRLVFDHSWKLLTEEERAALMKLSVFPGGFTREAAQSTAGSSVMLLSALVSKSLLRYGKKAGRYDFHELIRQYVLARLSEQPDQAQSAHTRHAEYFARWLAELEEPIRSAQQIPVSARIQAETDNWSAAWRWAAKHQRLDLLRQMTGCLNWYDEVHGDNAKALSKYAFAVEELRAAGAPAILQTDAQKSAFAFLLDQLGWFTFRTGHVKQAVALLNESLPLALNVETLDHFVLYHIYSNLGYLSLLTGEIEAARRLAEESLPHAHAIDSQWGIAIAVNILGIVEYQRGNVAEAYQQLTDSLKLWRVVGDPRGLVFCMLYLSSAALALGNYQMVESILQESNAIAQHKHDHWAHAFGLELLGQMAITRGQMQAAEEYFQQSLVLSQEIGDQWAATRALIHLGETQLALDDFAGAKPLFRQAYDNAQQARWLPVILEVLVAYLAADEEVPAETRLAITLAVLSHSAATLTTRQRAEHLRDQLAAALHPRAVEKAQRKAGEQPAEQWAAVVFQGPGTASAPYEASVMDWPAEG